jgi:hypothetical protein
MSTTEVEVQEIQPSFGKESKGARVGLRNRGISETAYLLSSE